LFGKVVDKEMKRAVEIGLREGKYDSILSEVNKLNFWRNGQAIELYSVPHENIETYIFSHIEQLILELTERCNLRCRYCIYNTSCDLNRDFGNNDMTRKDKNKTGISVNGVFAPPYTRKRLEKIAIKRG